MDWLVLTFCTIVWIAIAVAGIIVTFHLLDLEEWVQAGLSAVLFLFLLFAPIFYMFQKEEEQGPCLRYEQGYQYNPATKTIMPYTYCAERGTWVEE